MCLKTQYWRNSTKNRQILRCCLGAFRLDDHLAARQERAAMNTLKIIIGVRDGYTIRFTLFSMSVIGAAHSACPMHSHRCQVQRFCYPKPVSSSLSARHNGYSILLCTATKYADYSHSHMLFFWILQNRTQYIVHVVFSWVLFITSS